MGAIAGTMERVLLSVLGGQRTSPHVPRPPMESVDLDAHTLYLQVNSLERSTLKNYTTGARDYINFCICTPSPWTPHQPPCLVTLHTHPNSLCLHPNI
jgi:hypothetical protein